MSPSKWFGFHSVVKCVGSLDLEFTQTSTGAAQKLHARSWGQVLRLNLVTWPPTPVCIAQLSIVDKLGNPAGPAPKMVNLSAGHADFLDVAVDRIVTQFGQRTELRPVVTILPGAAAPSVCVALRKSMTSSAGERGLGRWDSAVRCCRPTVILAWNEKRRRTP